MIETIKRRVSVRTYLDQPIEVEKKRRIIDLLHSSHKGPFGHGVRFELVDFSEMERDEIKTLGTYGFISGAKSFIVGAIKEDVGAMEDLGYCFERVILVATSLGLGTCWMGGTFKRANFAKKINVSDEEVVPAISPIGYAHDKRTVRERVLRRFAGSDQRKPWEQLFFDEDMNAPLTRDSADKYYQVLDCVRLGPSASNNQPWRIVKQKDRADFHFYLRRTRGYDKLLRGIDLQRVDMGIAVCHFELAARETGLTGRWVVAKPDLDVGNAEYILSWTES